MAARPTRTVGYNCIFEKKPPDDIPTECPVCLLVLREPFQVTCCGKVFCKGCIKEVLQKKSVCPTCKKEEPKCFRDKRVKQTLHGYRVTCGERCGRSVCDWVGQLGQLDNHLNLDPPPEKQLKGCRFAEIKCKFCHKLFLRQQLNNHQLRDCPKRPFKCKHCGHKDTHERGITDHVPMCPKHPMPCPNCQHTYERQTLEHHINEKCPRTLVVCDYQVVGCEVKPARQEMQDHIKKEVMTHVSLLQQHLKKHPQSGDCLLLVTSCLERVMVNHQEIQEHNTQNLEQLIQLVKQMTVNCQVMCEKHDANTKRQVLEDDLLDQLKDALLQHIRTEERNRRHMEERLREDIEAAERRHKKEMEARLKKNMDDLQSRGVTVVVILGIVFIALLVILL